MISYRKKPKKDFKLTYPNRKIAHWGCRKLKQIEALNDHVILPCDANQGSCKQDGWTYIWDTTPIECPLMMVQIGNFRKEGDYLVDHELKLLFKPTSETQTDGIPGCPTGKVLYTDQKNIVL